MKTIVIYKSQSGFTRRYAEWIAEELEADLYEGSKVTIKMLIGYDTIIYGGGLYAVGINGVKLITGNLEKLKGKKVVVFATGASFAEEKAINDVCNKNFTSEHLKQIRFFYLQGGFDYNKLKPVFKPVMAWMKWSIKKKTERTADEQGMLEAFEKPIDFTDKQNIAGLIDYIKS